MQTRKSSFCLHDLTVYIGRKKFQQNARKLFNINLLLAQLTLTYLSSSTFSTYLHISYNTVIITNSRATTVTWVLALKI